MFNPFLLISAMILFGFAPFAGPSAQDATPAPAPAAVPARSHAKPTAESQARAKKLYSVDCAMCHGDNGNGKTDLAKDMQLTLADWSDPKSLSGQSDEDMFKAIRNGKGKMPPEAEGRAKDDDVWNIITFIRNMSKNQPAAPAAPTN